ncbi:histidinol-phosphatase [Verrucomicrobia bacterium LW23]|nr:histidinol-phosphatase [Verrucomicrobia bacterium LW23]
MTDVSPAAAAPTSFDSANSAHPAAPVLYETHSHTPLCKHSVGMPDEFAEVAVARGLRGYTITCHCPMEDGYHASCRMAQEQFDEYLRLVRKATATWAGRLDVLLGMESDYVPGCEAYIRRLHQRADFHYILGSVHPQVREYKQLYYKGDPFAYQRLYFTHLAEAAETGLYDCLAHPDLVKNEFPSAWNVERALPFICEALDRIAATGIAMEINTSGVNKAISQMNPGPEILREIAQRGIPMVIGADAHKPGRVADRFEEALGHLKDAGFTHIHLFRERKKQAIAIDIALASLRPAAAAVR